MSKKPVYKHPGGKTGKVPRSEEIVSYHDAQPVWRVAKLDFGGPWCPSGMDAAILRQILDRLSNFEGMTWHDIDKSGSHFVETWKLIRDAKKRLVDLNLDDYDALYSLRFTGVMRLWGIREGVVFSALWWDPGHQICPSTLKNT